MGLFDYLHDQSGREWQTKDFDCPYMEYYRITPEGRLEHRRTHFEDIPEAECPKGLKKGSFEEIRSQSRMVIDGWFDMNYHGILHAHDLDDNKVWWEAGFKFTDGKLVETEITRDPPIPAPEGETV